MDSRSTQPATAAAKETLTPVMTLQSQEDRGWTMAYFPDGKRMIGVSFDKTIRQWDLQAGKEIEEVRDVYEGNLYKAVVSRDGRWVMTSGGGEEHNELKTYEVETGIVTTFQDSRVISCIDISADGKLLASGAYFDHTVLVWGMDTGKLVAGPFESDHFADAIQFSPDSRKLAVRSEAGKRLEVWDVQTQKPDARVGKLGYGTVGTRAPMFWTKKGTILAVFNFVFDNDHSKSTTIYEFDALTLETIGDPFEGHTDLIYELALSFDGTLLASSSFDKNIKLWSLEPRQLLASLHVQHKTGFSNLIFSPDTRQLAYCADDKIFICNTPPDILASVRLAPDAQAIVRICCIYLIVDVLISSSKVSTPDNSTLNDLLNVHAPLFHSFTLLMHCHCRSLMQPVVLQTCAASQRRRL